MSTPRWFARPGLVLPVVAGLVVLSALLTPSFVAGRNGDDNATSRASAVMSAMQALTLRYRLKPTTSDATAVTIKAVLIETIRLFMKYRGNSVALKTLV